MKIAPYFAKWRGTILTVLFSLLCFPNAVSPAHSASYIAANNYPTVSLEHSVAASDETDDDESVDETTAGAMFLIFLALLFAIPIYFLPAVVALARDHEYKFVITIVNIFCAWTGLVWLGILAWSVWPGQSRAAIKEKRMTCGGEFAPTRAVTPPPFSSSTFYGKTRDGFTEENMNKLEKIGRLKQEGVLTEEEFQQAKERILENI